MRSERLAAALVTFGEPALEQVPEGAGIEATRAAVGTAVTVWNACVLATHWGELDALENLRTLAASGYLPSPLDSLLEPLILRYLEHHETDARLVAGWVVDPGPSGGIILHCEVKVPRH